MKKQEGKVFSAHDFLDTAFVFIFEPTLAITT